MSTQESTYKKKIAFTLAEVLITLGIIGVVAAMTLPALIQNYQKKLVCQRLKHFSSMMQQAAQLRNKDMIEGSFPTMNNSEVQPFNPVDMEKFFNIYWKPYIKTVSIKKMTKGLLVELANGSGAYFFRASAPQNWTDVAGDSYIVFCPEYKICEALDESKLNIDDSSMKSNFLGGQKAFYLWNSGRVPQEYRAQGFTRDELIEKCKTNKYYCSSLIEYDGWEIKDDYPW